MKVKKSASKLKSNKIKTKVPRSDIESRISRVTKPQTAPVSRISKEDAAEELVKQVLGTSDRCTANIQKSGKGRCIVVDFDNTDADKLTALVFGGSGIVIIAERNPAEHVFNSSKHTYDSIENASKFIRLGFLKGKPEAALRVPEKVSSGRFGKKPAEEASSLD
jgi:hypothetical protein